MKIGLRAGHSPNCLGAIGLRNEHYAMKDLYFHVKKLFEENGHTVIDCNSNLFDKKEEVLEGASIANTNNVEYFISLHMNSYNGQAYGTECWTVSENSKANNIANKILQNFSNLGFYSRGLKHNPEYWEMQYVNAPNIIFELCFCDNENDINLWSNLSWEQLSEAICSAFDGNIKIPCKPPVKEKTFYRVVAGSYENKENATNKIKELESKGIKDCFIVAFKQ